MSTQRQELATTRFSFVPTTLKEAQEYATIFANSGLCPEAYRGRPNDILIVWQMGNELGLDKMQALRTLGCINGIPFAYGDGALALVKRHRDFLDMKEWFEGEIGKNNLTAYCTITRKGKEPVTQKFSVEDAKTAGLWGKKGTWQLYPRRMLQHRARGFAAKDAFPDALYGLMSEDEAVHVVESQAVVEVIQPKNKGMQGLEQAIGIQQSEPETVVEVQVIEDEAIIDHPKEEIELSKLDALKELITRLDVSKSAVTITLKRFGVEGFENLTDEMIDKWTSHLIKREKKNDRI